MPKPELNYLQTYLVEEFVEDYRDGLMPRREMVARVLSVTGGVAATATLLLSLGCAPAAQPTATTVPAKPTEAPKPTAPAAAAATAPASPTAAAMASPTAATMASPTAAAMATAAPTSGAAATKPATSPAAGTPGTGPTNTPAPAPTPTQARSKLSVKPDDPAVTASDVTFPGDGVTVMAYLARPKDGTGLRGVLVCHENRGLTEHIRDVTRRLGKAGYAALAVDLLSRDGGTAKVDPTQVPGKLGNPAQHVADFQAGLRYLQSQSFVDRNKLGMVGFCFGGGITWLMAVNAPELKAAVPFYGPPPPSADVPKIRAAVLAIYAGNDQRINATIPDIEASMKQNNKTFEKIIYPNVNHAFHNDTGSSWDENAATDAWTKTLAWFDKYLV